MARQRQKPTWAMECVKGKECRMCCMADTIVGRWSDGSVTVKCPLCNWSVRHAFSIAADGTRGYLEPVVPPKE